MLAHYILVAARNLSRHRFGTLIAVSGLALGLACFIGARLFASYVERADMHFPNAERIHVVYQASSWQTLGLEVPSDASVTPLIVERLRLDFPQIEAIARVRTDGGAIVTVDGHRSFERVQYVDPELFEIFALPFAAGGPTILSTAARAAMISEAAALRLLGTTDVIGRVLRIDPVGDVEIAGVLAPVPDPSHLAGTYGDDAAGILVVTRAEEDIVGQPLFDPDAADAPPAAVRDSIVWLGLGGMVTAYLLLPADGSLTAADMNAALPGIVERHAAVQNGRIEFEVRHVSVRLSDSVDDFVGPFTDVSLIGLLQALGALVLAVACLNFVNLTTVRAAVRGKEIGLRKTLGARRGQLVAQHVAESVLAASAATLLALAVVQVGVTVLAGATELTLPSLRDATVQFWLFVAGLTFAVGAAGGLYPALVLARIPPTAALRIGSLRVGSGNIRNLLIVLQFSAASFLLIIVLVVAGQNAELARRGPAADADPLVAITTRLQDGGIDAELFRARLESSPHVVAVTGADTAPWEGLVGGTGFSRRPDDPGAFKFTQTQTVSYDYFSTLDIPLLAGRTYERDRDVADDPAALQLVIDRAAAEQFGWTDPGDAVGEVLYAASLGSGPTNPVTIIGVVEHAPARVFGWGSRAFVYTLDPDGITRPIVRISPHAVSAALAHIDETWQALSSELPIRRELVDERFERAYRLFARVVSAFAILAAIAFAISLTGLLGMVLFVVARRRHEMGVRKVLGASSPGLMRLLLWQFVRPVLIANVVAWPLAYVAAKTYVDIFMYPIRLTAGPFVQSLAVTVLVAAAVVARQAVSSARLKPAAVLRYE